MLENKGPVGAHVLGSSPEVIENKGSDYLACGAERLGWLRVGGGRGRGLRSRKRQNSEG
jgi:hypothetical protein